MLAVSLLGRAQLGLHKGAEPPQEGGCPGVQQGVGLYPWEGQSVRLCVVALPRGVLPQEALLACPQGNQGPGRLGLALGL